MKPIDLDDLPPRTAQILRALAHDEELVLVEGGLVVGRLVAAGSPAPSGQSLAETPDEERMKEVMDHFNAMIHDEF